jgi:diguanylate cyclase (GGDEF)-like protein/PAS domain S-box-containing protein
MAKRKRVPALTALSSDWTWEQDAAMRFTRFDMGNGTPAERSRARSVIGKCCWESGIEVEGGWESHKALLAARKPYRDVLMWRELEDGSRRYVHVCGEPFFDAAGRFRGYRGVGRNVTAQKRGEHLLRLQYDVTRDLADAGDALEGCIAALRAICESERWDRGELWRLDETGHVMRRFAYWVAPGAAVACGPGEEALAYRPGEGLVGQVWRSAEPLSVEGAERAAGLRSHLLCPVPSGGRIVGVIGFACRRIRPPDPALLQALVALSTQLGLFLRRTDAEAHLRESEARFRQVVDSANEGIVVYDRELRIRSANAAAARIIGVPHEQLVGRAGIVSVFPCVQEDGSPIGPQDRPTRVTTRTGQPLTGMIMGITRPDGTVTWVSVNTAFLRNAGEAEHYGIVSTFSDITVRRGIEFALRQSEARFRALTAMSSDFFWETDALHHLLGMAHGSGELQSVDLFLGPEGWAALRETMDTRRPFRDVELARRQEDGTTRYYAVSGEPQLAADGRFVGYRGVGRDITDIALARERIASLAYSDALTGLDNRSSLVPTLEKAIERTRRRGTKLAGLFVDLDGFKQINDAHGHDAGDRLLIEVGRRLRAGLRSSDPVARLGGDEFFIVLEDLSDAAPAERVAQKILAAILEPYELGPAAQGRLTASIGISLYPDDAGDASTLMKHADTAMYQAKEAGKNAYSLFGRGAAANDPRAEEAGSA